MPAAPSDSSAAAVGQPRYTRHARPGGLPGDGGLAEFSLLLPLGAPALRGSDVVTDDTGRRFVVGTAALSELGWRVSLRQVGA